MKESTDLRGLSQKYGRVSLEGAQAFEFLEQFGWTGISDSKGFQYSGDTVTNNHFVVSRYAHNAAKFAFSTPPQFQGLHRLMLLVCVKGAIFFKTATGSVDLTPGKAILVDPDQFIGAEIPERVQCMFTIYRDHGPTEHAVMLSGTASQTHFRMLSAASASMLDEGITPEDEGFYHLQTAIEQLSFAVASRSELQVSNVASEQASALYLRAIALISLHASNPETTVASIAVKLGVSRANLFRVFKNQGSTPSRYLRDYRVALARECLEAGNGYAMAASVSGFGTQRRLRDALRETVRASGSSNAALP